jgi:exosortase
MQKHTGNGILEDFRIEFMDCWQRLPNKSFFFVLLAAWLALFHFIGNSVLGYGATSSLLDWMYKAYGGGLGRNILDSDEMYGALVPFGVLVLFWFKRRNLLAVPMRLWSPGLLWIVFGLILHILGFLIQQPRVSMLGMFSGIFGLMGMAWGPAWLRASFFPFVFLLFAIPLGSFSQAVTVPLQLLVSKLVAFVCNNLLAIDVVREGNILRDPGNNYHYEVAAACSGIKSLFAITALAIVMGLLSFRSWWKRGLFIASAVPLAIFGNMVRLLSIIIAAAMWGQKTGEMVHEGGPMGVFALMLYVPSIAGLLILEHYFGDYQAAKRAARKTPSGAPTQSGMTEVKPGDVASPAREEQKP